MGKFESVATKDKPKMVKYIKDNSKPQFTEEELATLATLEGKEKKAYIRSITSGQIHEWCS